jgi:23S rRNA (uridine2552-2'-O)-methyltransferase
MIKQFTQRTITQSSSIWKNNQQFFNSISTINHHHHYSTKSSPPTSKLPLTSTNKASTSSNFPSSTSTTIKNKKLSKSSKEWLNRQLRDVYVKMKTKGATEQSKGIKYRSRAGFKLQQLDEKYQFIKHAAVIIDLGAAPGAWTQYAAKSMKKDGILISLDLLTLDPLTKNETENLKQHIIITGDFTQEETIQKIKDTLSQNESSASRTADVILSDMAPNTTGVQSMDHGRIMQLCHSVIDFSLKGALKPGGTLLLKIFSGSEEIHLRERLKELFTAVATVKPDASRQDSKEMYIYARNFTPHVVQKKDKNATDKNAISARNPSIKAKAELREVVSKSRSNK